MKCKHFLTLKILRKCFYYDLHMQRLRAIESRAEQNHAFHF